MPRGQTFSFDSASINYAIARTTCVKLNIEEKTYEKIEQYLEGKLRGAELRDFKHRMKVDDDFYEEVEAVRHLFKVIDMAGDPDLQEKLEEMERRKFQREERNKFKVNFQRKSWYLVYTAVAMFLVIASACVVSFLMGPTSQSLFKDNFEIYPLAVSYATPEWKQFALTYEARNYGAALEELKLIEGSEDIPEHVVSFYTGIMYLAQNDAHSRVAIGNFDQVMQSRNVFYDEAQWYKGLAYLEAGETEKAKLVFQNIAADVNAYRHAAAVEILKDL